MGLKQWAGELLLHAGRTLIGAPLRDFLPHSVNRLVFTTAALHLRSNIVNNAILSKGARHFSQNDEDGILIEILRRIEVKEPGLFVEFGVGNGLENNTLILLASGWKGAWIGGETLAFNSQQEGSRLMFLKKWVTSTNAAGLAREGIRPFGADLQDVRVCSIDLDGNDFHVASELLSAGLRPDIFIVEYNAKFPPTVQFVMKYSPVHTWSGGDYFGASLLSWNGLFAKAGYRLVACNASGVNAFFVREEFTAAFSDVPTELEKLYVEGNYLPFPTSGHPTTPATIEQLISG